MVVSTAEQSGGMPGSGAYHYIGSTAWPCVERSSVDRDPTNWLVSLATTSAEPGALMFILCNEMTLIAFREPVSTCGVVYSNPVRAMNRALRGSGQFMRGVILDRENSICDAWPTLSLELSMSWQKDHRNCLDVRRCDDFWEDRVSKWIRHPASGHSSQR
jgi:hypothetical protein